MTDVDSHYLRDRLQATLGTAYTLERELGGGGMSRVFAATETALGRSVVVKLLAPELAAGVSVERFAREVSLAARLQHANIVPLLSAGDADGLPFYTMPFVRGESLRARVARGALSVSEAATILRDMARALAYAHSEGIVHRDVKPENVLLSGGAAMVADFGIAKAVRAALAPQVTAGITLTQAGHALGTPAYMAPEQASGDPTTDHRADLYAWGAVAYELLTGAHAFADRASAHAMIAAHLSELPAPLSQRRPDVPSALAEVVMRCLEKDPAHRPQSADDLIVALDRMNTPTHDRTGWRRLGIIAASVSAIAVMALTAWVATHRIGSVSSSKAIAVLPFESVGGDTANAYFAEGMADELATALTKVAGIKVKGRHSALAFKGNHAAAQELGRALGVGAILEGTVRQEGDRMRVSAQLTSTADGEVLWRETYQRAVTGVFAVQDEITHAIVGALRVTLVGGDRATVNVGNAGTTNLEAYQLYLRGMYFYRRRRVDKAIDNFQAAIASDSTFARAHAWLGLSWSTSTLVGGAPISATFPRAIAEADRALALDSSTAEAYVAVGLAHLWSHHWDRADDAFRRALALDPNLAIGRLWYSWLLSATGRMREAMTEIELAKALDPLDAATVAVEARTFSSGGRNAEAIAEARRAVELDSTLGFAQMNLLIALVDGGQAPEARMRAERSSNPLAGFAAYAIGRGGDPTRAAVLAREMVPQQDAAVLMRAWFGAGDTAQALSELERMVETGDANLISTPLTGHIYDPVRGSPRFVAVVRRLGLKPELFTASRRQ